MKHRFYLLLLIPCFCLFFSCGSGSEQKQHDSPVNPDSAKTTAAYICPCGTCGFEGSKEPGECPKCHMQLEKAP